MTIKKILTILFLLTIQLYCQDYLNIKYIGDTYKYALINDLSEITFNTGGTNMTITFTDASSTVEDISTIVEMTFDASILGGGSPLPVELVSFTAVLNENKVTLLWTTATEVDNYGFEIQRSTVIPVLSNDGDWNLTNWKRIGFIEGYGNSNSPKEYSFTDYEASSGIVEYRLKQIDTDGSFEYSNVIFIELGVPTEYELSQNYPNPFNPTTKISYKLPMDGFVTIMVYNIQGKVIAVLVDENKKTETILLNSMGIIYPAEFTSANSRPEIIPD
jgi:hypothetical protein